MISSDIDPFWLLGAAAAFYGALAFLSTSVLERRSAARRIAGFRRPLSLEPPPSEPVRIE